MTKNGRSYRMDRYRLCARRAGARMAQDDLGAVFVQTGANQCLAQADAQQAAMDARRRGSARQFVHPCTARADHGLDMAARADSYLTPTRLLQDSDNRTCPHPRLP